MKLACSGLCWESREAEGETRERSAGVQDARTGGVAGDGGSARCPRHSLRFRIATKLPVLDSENLIIRMVEGNSSHGS